MPGQYDKNAANAVSNIKPKFSAQFRIPWCTIEFRRVLQTIKSAHCTTTIDTKKAVWHVYSSVLRSRYVCNNKYCYVKTYFQIKSVNYMTIP